MMEGWNTGIMGAHQSITLKTSAIHGINSTMDRKHINSGFKVRSLYKKGCFYRISNRLL